MKIGIFAYNFPHKKTQEGIFTLLVHHYYPVCIFAADPVELKFYQSKIRVTPKSLVYLHPRDIAANFNIPYHVIAHNSLDCEKLIRKYDLDIGIILGARILKDNIIKAFKVGVVNMHPGMLPYNRGLDNLKWAVIKGYKQGVSVHLISKEIDQGSMIMQREVEVYEDDTLVDVFLRIQNMEQVLMIESLKILESGQRDFPKVTEGNYFKSLPPEEEAHLCDRFEEYKRKYKELAS